MRRGRLLLALVAVGCGDDAPVSDANTTPAAAAVQTAAPAAVEAAPATYSYSSVGRRDPFQSYLIELAALRKAEEAERRLEATEQFELSQYRLTAVITGTTQPRALVEDPSGMGHVLQVGSKLGRNNGRVTRITPSGVLLVEQHRDGLGKVVRVPVKLELPEEPPMLLMGKR